MRSLKNTAKINLKVGELEKSSLILFAVMMSCNFLNYLFQIVMGKRFEPEEYGILMALLSIIAIVSVVSMIITMITAKYTLKLIYANRQNEIKHLVLSMLKVVVFCVLVIILIGAGFSKKISFLLKVDNSNIVIFTVVISSISLFVSVVLGVLQGLKRFFHFGLVTLIGIAGKLIFSIVLVAVGWSLFGPLTAYMLGMIISLMYGFFFIRDKTKKHNVEREFRLDLNEFFKFGGEVFLIQICVSIIVNGDVLLIKHFFTPLQAGVYSSAMVIGKISMYVATSIVAALFPMTIERVEKELDTKHLLYKSLLYAGGLACITAFMLNAFSGIIINMLYGERYLVAASLLFPVSVFVIPVTLFVILMNFQLATGQTKSLIWILLGCILACGILVQIYNSTMAQMIYCVAIVLAIGVLIDIIIVLISQNKTYKKVKS